jgi:hypothetical protein
MEGNSECVSNWIIRFALTFPPKLLSKEDRSLWSRLCNLLQTFDTCIAGLRQRSGRMAKRRKKKHR